MASYCVLVSREKKSSNVLPPLRDFLLLFPSEDGTVQGISEYGIWSGLLRAFRRYDDRTSTTLEINGAPPEHADCLLDLVPNPRVIHKDVVDLIAKVDVVSEDKLSDFVVGKKQNRSSNESGYNFWERVNMQELTQQCEKADIADRKNVYAALLSGILLIVPFHCLQSTELVAEIINYLTRQQSNKPDDDVVRINLKSVTVVDIHDDVLPQFQITQGKVSKYGPDGLLQGAPGHRRAMKALNHAKMVYLNYISMGLPEEPEDWYKSTLQVAQRLESIRYHSEGGVVETAKWRTWSARLYVVFTFVVSILSGSLNWAGRDNYYERISDIVQSLTVLWISVFGLIKLTSEDENAIRNTLLGKNILRSSGDVMKYAKCKDEEELKRGMIRAGRLEWLDPAECCYISAPMPGSIRVLGGISIIECLRKGMLLLGDRIFDDADNEYGHIFQVSEDGTHHFESGNLGKMQTNFQVVTESGVVA